MMFVLKENNELHPYYGYIRFFFRICITLRHDGQQEEIWEFIFSYVEWMSFRSPELDKLSGLYMVNNKFYEQDRITRFAGRCVLAPAEKGSCY